MSTPVVTEGDAVGARVKKGYYLDRARCQKARINAGSKGGERTKNGGCDTGSKGVGGKVEGENAGDKNPEDTPLPETSQSLQDSSREGNKSNISEEISKLRVSMAEEENWCSFESYSLSFR